MGFMRWLYRFQLIRHPPSYILVLTTLCLVCVTILVTRGYVADTSAADVRFISVADECASEIDPPRRPLPHRIRTRGPWQVYAQRLDSDDVELVIYSTFYDDRPILGNASYLRTLGISSFKDHVTTFYCQIWYQQLSYPVVVEAELLRVGRDYVINNATYRQLLISCELPKLLVLSVNAGSLFSIIPSHLSLTTSSCSQSSILSSVIRPNRDGGDLQRAANETLGVCVAVSFGSLPVDELVEWFELNRMLGIDEFNVYNATLTSQLDKVFDYYSRRVGVLNMHQMQPPVVDELTGVTMDTIKVSSPASLNDCMLRNMFRYRYVVVIDFDEVIVPRRYDNYAAMLNAIYRSVPEVKVTAAEAFTDQHHTLAFRNAFFFRDFGSATEHSKTSTKTTNELPSDQVPLPETGSGHRLMTSKYRQRAPISHLGHAPKSFVDPRRCLSLFNHYCYIRFRKDVVDSDVGMAIGSEGVMGGPWSSRLVDVPTDFGVSHHYRSRCNSDLDTCKQYATERRLDRSTERFENQLRERVAEVLGLIN